MEELLKLIEEVSPDDTANLDEIDARVWCWLEGYTLDTFDAEEYGEFTVKERDGHFGIEDMKIDGQQYTRSRDALKAIRPDHHMMITHTGECWRCVLSELDPTDPFNDPLIEFEGLAETEELAELHAIIQAIDHERSCAKQD